MAPGACPAAAGQVCPASGHAWRTGAAACRLQWRAGARSVRRREGARSGRPRNDAHGAPRAASPQCPRTGRRARRPDLYSHAEHRPRLWLSPQASHTCRIRFKRSIAQRPPRRLVRLRRGLLAATREVLSSAPPATIPIAQTNAPESCASKATGVCAKGGAQEALRANGNPAHMRLTRQKEAGAPKGSTVIAPACGTFHERH